MKKIMYYSLITPFLLSAELRDWIPSFWNNQAKPKTIEQLVQDPELNKECYNERLLAANRGEYARASACELFKNMQKNIQKAKEIEIHLSNQRMISDKQMSLQNQLQESENQKYKKIAVYSALFGGGASISGLILKSLFSPRSMRYTGLPTWFGFGTVLGFTIGTWRTAQKEQALKEQLQKVKK